MPRLEQWAFGSAEDSGYLAPEQMTFLLSGTVYDHPCFDDGVHITTSELVDYEDDVFVTHSGSRYTLGEPAADYEARFPNAYARIVKAAGRAR